MRDALKFKFLCVLAVAVLAAAVYGRTIFADFVWEDAPFILNNAYVHSLGNVPSFFTAGDSVGTDMVNPYYRPVTTTTFTLDYNLWKGSPAGFHATNVAFHIGAAILFLLLLAEFMSLYAAFPAALLFALHPALVEPVAYVSGRADAVCSFFLLASVLAFTGELEKRNRVRGSLAVILCAFSLMAKEVGVLTPAVIAGVIWLKGKGRRDWLWLLPFAAVTAAYLFMRHAAAGVTGVGTDPLATRIATAGVLFWRYALMSVFPFGLDYFYFLPPWTDPFSLGVVAAWAALFAVFATIARGLLLKSPAALGFAWYFAGLAPVSGLLMLMGPALMSHRYLYVPLLGGLFGVAALLDRALSHGPLKGRGREVLSAFTALALAFGFTAFGRAGTWKDNLSLWGAAYAENPDVAGAADGYASALIHANRCDEAERVLRDAREKGAGDAGNAILHAIIAISGGRYTQAVSETRAVLDAEPENAWALSILAEALFYSGDPCAARRAADKAASLSPNDGRLAELAASLREACP